MLKKEGMNVVEIKTALLGLFSKLFMSDKLIKILLKY